MLVIKFLKMVYYHHRKKIFKRFICLQDGRYKEQKNKIGATNLNKHNIVFLIEGSFFSYKSRWTLPKSTILSSLVNTLFRDGFSIIRTQSFNETCEYLAKITKTAINSPEKILLKEVSNDYKTTIQVKKKLNITPEICFYTQLSLFHYQQIATYLVDNYCFIELCKYCTVLVMNEMLFANDLIKTS